MLRAASTFPLWPAVRRWIYLLHRYLGLLLCLVFLFWFVSGVAMLYVRMPILTPPERFAARQHEVDWTVQYAPQAHASRRRLQFPKRARLGRADLDGF